MNVDSQNDPASRKDNRFFLGLQRPPISTAADWLADQYADDDCLELSGVVVVLPTARASNRLLQLLILISEQRGLAFTPPAITTLGGLPEYLYSAEKRLASDLTQQIAWGFALEETPADELESLVGRIPDKGLEEWQPLAKLLSRLHRRLGNDVWSFSSVLREVQKLPNFLPSELKRWQVLDAVQRRYYSRLTEADLWDRQAARSVAVKRKLCSTSKTIVMVATADLSRSITGMLDQVYDQVRILVAAEESMQDRFDEFGTLITEKWLEASVAIDDRKLMVVDTPSDQGFATSYFISELAKQRELSADEISIGVPDPAVVPQIERSLNAIGAKHRNLAGRPLAETTPVRLMVACRDYIRSQSFDAFASLVRHPDLFQMLSTALEADEWLDDLDTYQTTALPSRIPLAEKMPFGNPATIRKRFDPDDTSSKKRAGKLADARARLNQVHQSIAKFLLPLTASKQPIGHWSQHWSDVLAHVYAERVLDRENVADRQTIKACDAIFQAFGEHQDVPGKWATTMSSVQALDMALEAATEIRVVAPPEVDAIELAGWLDLILDDAPVMVITGLNDEHVPTSEFGHQFLPNMLCETLDIEDNDRRFARDVYALHVIHEVREDLLLVTGRRDAKGEPKKPSRLLFACNPQTAADRARAFFGFEGKAESRNWLAPNVNEEDVPTTQQFAVPRPAPAKPIELFPVTQFKVFLQCPYRFYLSRVMGLQTVADDSRELDGGLFGDLAHNVLEAFGRHKIRSSDRPGEIREFLCDELETQASLLQTGSRLPAIRIQIEQLRMRLEQFSEHQARYRREGWLIVSTEEMLYHEFDVDGVPFRIRGKIDRVDRNENDDRVAVWDYKSSDAGKLPQQAHWNRNKGWIDLQLPLYRYLVQQVDAVEDANLSKVGLGYILLPKAIEKVGFASVEWDAQRLQEADQLATDVLRKIRAQEFWPPVEIPPLYSEDFAAICQDNIFEKVEVNEVAGKAAKGNSEIEEAPF